MSIQTNPVLAQSHDVEKLLSKLAILLQSKPEFARRIGGVVVLHCPDLGSSWTLNLNSLPSVTKGEGSGDCEVKIDSRSLLELARGEVSAQRLFLEGKLRLRGDTTLGAQFHRLFEPL